MLSGQANAFPWKLSVRRFWLDLRVPYSVLHLIPSSYGPFASAGCAKWQKIFLTLHVPCKGICSISPGVLGSALVSRARIDKNKDTGRCVPPSQDRARAIIGFRYSSPHWPGRVFRYFCSPARKVFLSLCLGGRSRWRVCVSSLGTPL